MDDDKARKDWREYAEFEPARTPADDEARRKAWAVIGPMLCCLWIIVFAGLAKLFS